MEALAAARARHLRRCALLARLIREHTNYTPYVYEHHFSSNCALAVERAMQLWARVAAGAPAAGAATRCPWPEPPQWMRPPPPPPAPSPEAVRREVARCLRLEAAPVHAPDV